MFDVSPILEITYSVSGGELLVSWVSTAPRGSWYQLYANGLLVHWTQNTYSHQPAPSSRIYWAVGVVDEANVATDYADELPAMPAMEARLSWYGGRYLAEDIAAYRVYMGAEPGDPPDYARPVAEVPAFSASQYLDGFGRGRFGRGGFGRAEQAYEWTSDRLRAGTWNFGIQSVDDNGNPCDEPRTGSVVISGPPEPPARAVDGTRLRYFMG